MGVKDKTKVELISELKELLQENNSLKTSLKKNITEQSQSEEKFKEVSENWQATFDAIDDIFLLLSPNHEIIEINQAGLAALNKTRGDVLGEKCFYLVHNTNSPIVECPCAISLNEKKVARSEYTVDNKIYELVSWPIFDENNNIKALTHIVKDITERKLAEQTLFKSEEMMRNSQSVAHICSYSTNLIVEDIAKSPWDCSPEFYEIFGIDKTYPHTIEGWAGFIHPDFREEMVAYHEYVIKEKIRFEHEYKIIRINDGAERWVYGTGKLEFDEKGNPIRMHGAIQDITERKQVEENLKNSEKLLSETESIGKVGGWSFNIDTMQQIWTDEVYRIHEVEISPGPGVDAGINYYTNESRSIIGKAVQRAIEHGENYDLELEIITAKGNARAVHTIGKADLKNRRISGFFQDITERKQAEEKIREKDIQFRKLSSNLPDLIYQFTRRPDGSYCVPIASEGIKNIFGCSPEDVVEDFTPIGRVIYPEDAEKVINDIEYSAKHISYFTCEFRVQIPGRPVQWILSRSTPEKLPDGSVTWYGFNANITERKQAEEKLKLLNCAVEASSVAVEITDAEGNINYINPFFTELTGYSYEEARGKNPRFLQSGNHPKEFYKDLWDTILSGKDWTGEFQNKKKNGELYWEKAVISPILNSNGEVTNFVAIKEDVTERKRVMAELGEAKEKAEESDRLKSAFLANMSHEIRTPMNGILGFSELLKKPDLTGEQQQEYIRIIEKSGARMLNTVNNIVDMSKIESGLIEVSIKKVNINEKVQFAYNFFKPEAESKGLQLFFINGLPNEDANIKTDHEKVYAVLINILKNSIKYSDKGSIVFGYNIKESIDSRDSQYTHFLEFFVKDAGIGIPKDRQEAIFERFIQADVGDTRAFQGSGLGLSISKSYVEMLGGKIWVESEEGKGSIFYFTIPYNAGSEEKNTIKNVITIKEKEVQINNLKILIAEDDIESNKLITLRVKELSKEILHAENGIEAVEICRNNPDIDLILMDIQMPKMDGLEATLQIRQFNKDVIIIAQTAYAFLDDEKKAKEAGCNHYVSKPINYTLLIEYIKMLFDEKK